MKRLTATPLWMATWLNKVKGRRDWKKGVAKVKVDKGSEQFVVVSEYLKLLDKKKDKLVRQLKNEYMLEISDLVVKLKTLKKRKMEPDGRDFPVSHDSEAERDREAKVNLEAAISKCHKRYVEKRDDIDTSYNILERAYHYGVDEGYQKRRKTDENQRNV